MQEAGRGPHDMGGESAGPVDQSAHERLMWEKRVDALVTLLGHKDRQILRVDELRRSIEQLGAEAYDRMSYYERWVASMTNVLLEKGIVTSDELGRRMAEVEARQAEEAGR